MAKCKVIYAASHVIAASGWCIGLICISWILIRFRIQHKKADPKPARLLIGLVTSCMVASIAQESCYLTGSIFRSLWCANYIDIDLDNSWFYYPLWSIGHIFWSITQVLTIITFLFRLKLCFRNTTFDYSPHVYWVIIGILFIATCLGALGIAVDSKIIQGTGMFLAIIIVGCEYFLFIYSFTKLSKQTTQQNLRRSQIYNQSAGDHDHDRDSHDQSQSGGIQHSRSQQHMHNCNQNEDTNEDANEDANANGNEKQKKVGYVSRQTRVHSNLDTIVIQQLIIKFVILFTFAIIMTIVLCIFLMLSGIFPSSILIKGISLWMLSLNAIFNCLSLYLQFNFTSHIYQKLCGKIDTFFKQAHFLSKNAVNMVAAKSDETDMDYTTDTSVQSPRVGMNVTSKMQQ